MSVHTLNKSTKVIHLIIKGMNDDNENFLSNDERVFYIRSLMELFVS